MSAGKGDTPRKVDGVKFRANYVNIFKKNETTTEHPHTDNPGADERLAWPYAKNTEPKFRKTS
jgi:hypothetical protein